MSHKPLVLHEDALFIADAHYSFKHPLLLDFLQEIHSKKIVTTQLILMGDIFDLLFTDIVLTLERNREVINLINVLSETIEIIYLEGNHDFNVEEIFPNIQVYPLSKQPVKAQWMNKHVALAHGDFGGERGYKVYTALIRNRLVQKILNSVDRLGNNFILNALDTKLKEKDDCRSIKGFETYVQKHLSQIDLSQYDYFIEGHFHQNIHLNMQKCRYINLAAFACQERYAVVRTDSECSMLKDVKFMKGQA